jgi:16S rRNA (cytidine1402-2'-O)-methyltransferase
MSSTIEGGTGRLLLVPNALDQGSADEADIAGAGLQLALPMAVLQAAAALEHWIAETPKVARVFLKRVHAVVPLVRPLQELSIVELPRPRKGGGASRAGAAADTAVSARQWEQLLEPTTKGFDVGLLSDAGMPAVADPGAELVRAAHDAGVDVVPLAGASALLLALAASGLNGQSFAFVGYLPVDAADRAKRLQELEALSRRSRQTQLFIETPYRNTAMLGALLVSLSPQTSLSMSCGLTTPQGWTRTATVAAWRRWNVAVPNDLPAVFALLA